VAEGRGFAEFELEDLGPGIFKLAGTPQHWPADVVPDLAEPRCLRQPHVLPPLR
jgi:hypothetical protein